MRRHSASVLGAVLLACALAGCASAPGSGGVGSPAATSEPTRSSEPPADAQTEDAAAREQAQTWLDAVTLPPGAVPADAGVARFTSYTGWPCGPAQELEAFWTLSDASVSATANWLRENPTAGLLSTSVAPVADNPAIDSAIVGYIPAADAQEGIVYTVAKTDDGVAVRAEIAALTASAVCPPLPDGGAYGAPGQG